ncbi:hypothetical protein D3C72_2361780 [compost metagenome]
MVVVDVDHQRAQHAFDAGLDLGLQLLQLARLDIAGDVVVGVEAFLRCLQARADPLRDGGGRVAGRRVGRVEFMRAACRVLAVHG